MQYKKEHEPELNDMDDYHRPMPKKKFRVIIASFILLGTIWALLQWVSGLISQ